MFLKKHLFCEEKPPFKLINPSVRVRQVCVHSSRIWMTFFRKIREYVLAVNFLLFHFLETKVLAQ